MIRSRATLADVSRRTLSWLCRAYGAVLTFSAVAKVLAPAAFLLAITSLGASSSQARAILAFAVFLEAAVGLWLAIRPAPVAACSGAVLSVGLLVGHLAMRETIGGLDCGCFGSIAIDDASALALAAIGLVVCTSQHLAGNAAHRPGWRLARKIHEAPAASAHSRRRWLRRRAEPALDVMLEHACGQNPPDSLPATPLHALAALLHELSGLVSLIILVSASAAVLTHIESNVDAKTLVAGGLQSAPDNSVVVVGSPTCLKCAAHVGQLAQEGRDVIVLYSESDFWLAKPSEDKSVRIERVPDLVWARLLDRAPPTCYLHTKGNLVPFVDRVGNAASAPEPPGSRRVVANETTAHPATAQARTR